MLRITDNYVYVYAYFFPLAVYDHQNIMHPYL